MGEDIKKENFIKGLTLSFKEQYPENNEEFLSLISLARNRNILDIKKFMKVYGEFVEYMCLLVKICEKEFK